MVISGVLVFLALMLMRDPAPVFVYDAGQYWLGSELVADGRDPWLKMGLNVRGVLSAFVYLPAALAVKGLGVSAGTAVLVQNAVMIAVLGAVVLPCLAGRVVALRSRHVLLSAALSALVLSGFAPYPLMDLVAGALVLSGVLLADAQRWYVQVVGALCLGAAVNLRPAHLATVVLVVLVVLVVRRLRVIPVAMGVLLALLPQALYLRRHDYPAGLMPPDSFLITQIQVGYGAYGVRYDTVAYSNVDPRQWYCDPSMARAVDGDLPTTARGLFGTFVGQLPDSASFAIDKVVAALQWNWATPYAPAGTPGWTALGLAVLLVTVVGVVGLVVLWPRAGRSVVAPCLVATVVGTAVTLVGSAPETRFALPIVLVGIVGWTILFGNVGRASRRRLTVLGASAAVVFVAILGLAVLATGHPAEPGDVTAATCGES
ncbi:hypothetical protein [Nocardioides sp. YIM 152315]|uniref:hypothetical protein n=1 Tax=Nocardioides sp. YIM 152315 TaxID=3031760 RepID=UPI0023DAD108|nr:hypothetical protein [Nocardioides sp. YIM 152315]MDF1604305.1 hypothetical protein [Nocardioides sp. YIM 152315]